MSSLIGQTTMPALKPLPATHLPEALRKTSYFRTLDPIENFRLNIVLTKIADTKNPIIDHHTIITIDSKENVNAASAAIKPLNEPEILTVSWQQKVLSPEEVLQYANLSPYATMKDKKYHDQVTKLVSNFGRESRLLTAKKIEAAQWSLFTYIDSDDYIDIEDTQREIISNPGMDTAVLSPLARRIFGDNSVNRERSMTTSSSESTLLSEGPSREHIKLTNIHCSTMYIMSSFLMKTNETYILTTKRIAGFKVYDYGLISMTPAPSSKPYSIHLPNGDVYSISITHASDSLTQLDEEKEWRIYMEFFRRQKHLREASLPPFNTLNETYGLELNIMGEIISAHDFDQGDIQLFWSLEPGEEWNILSSTDTDGKPSPLYSFAIDDEHVSSGYTQSSTAVWSDENEVFESYFGMPLEFHLGCTEYDISTRGPKIYFEVRSVDSWGRGKVCGYGWTYLPSAPGCFDQTISTWKPRGTRESRLREYYLGSGAVLDDFAYISTGSQGETSKLVKYGFRTETTGKIKLRWNVLGRGRSFMPRKKKEAEDPLRFVKGQGGKIMDALSRAKARLESLKFDKKNS